MALPRLVIADCQMLNYYRFTTVKIVNPTQILAMTLTLSPPEGFRYLPGDFFGQTDITLNPIRRIAFSLRIHTVTMAVARRNIMHASLADRRFF